MKTSIVTLQGQDFIVTEPAQQILMLHLKKLQKLTHFRPGAYRDNVEALRDVLIEQGGKKVSKTGMLSALSLVGLPEKRSLNDTIQTRFPRLYLFTERVRRPLAKVGRWAYRHWLQSLIAFAAVVTIIMSAGYIFSGVMAALPNTAASGWQTMSTSIGPVRHYNDQTDGTSNASDWLFGWQTDIVYAVLLLIISMLLLRLRRKGRLPFVLALIGCGFLLLCLHFVRQQSMPDYATGKNVSLQTKPIQPRLAYLRQCGDEIQYVFDGSTDGMLFRQLRDEGFSLSVTIPTRESDGKIDTKTLCQQYDVLRRDHAKADIVLQYYAKNEDGTIRPYEYSDLGEGISSYGLFVRA
jgi:hypothetical protein